MTKVEVVPVADEKYIELLAKDFPNLKVEKLDHLGSGWDSAAMLVNSEYVFRFPRYLFEDRPLLSNNASATELKILKALAGKLPFAIPKPEYIAPKGAYFGYKMLPGVLWDEAPTEPTSTEEFLRNWVETRQTISGALSQQQAKEIGLESYDADTNVSLSQEYLKSEAATAATRRLVEQALQIVESEMPDETGWVFIHEDLQPKNCLLDPDSYLISGVLDFGDAEIGPVEADYAFWGKWRDDSLERLAKIQSENGYDLNVRLVKALQILYFAADIIKLGKQGFAESVQAKAEHLNWHAKNRSQL